MIRQSFSLIITVVDVGFSEKVIEASKVAGAEGATIIKARGTGVHENQSIMGIPIQPEKEVVLILVKKSIRKLVMREIVKTSNLTTEGKGLTFSVPVDEVAGVNHLFHSFKKKKDQKVEKGKEKKRVNW